MLKKVLKKIEKLNADKIKFIDEQSKIQKKINDIEIEIKDYTAIKRDYEKIEKKFTELTKLLQKLLITSITLFQKKKLKR